MFHVLDPFFSVELCERSAAEILALSSLVEERGYMLEKFRLGGQPCGPNKLRLTRRNSLPWSGAPEATYAQSELWDETELFELAPITRMLVNSLQLEARGRILAIITPPGSSTPNHTDHDRTDFQQEFFWIRLSAEKRLHLVTIDGRKELPEGSRAVWFDSRLQHGSVESDQQTVSLRIDGRFSPDLRKKLSALSAAGPAE